MIRRSISAIVLAAATFAPVASHAFPIFGHSDNATTAQPKVKMVKMTLVNKTSTPMAILIGDQPVTIAANGQYAAKIAEGTNVTDPDHAVKVHVTRELDGTTCSFR